LKYMRHQVVQIDNRLTAVAIAPRKEKVLVMSQPFRTEPVLPNLLALFSLSREELGRCRNACRNGKGQIERKHVPIAKGVTDACSECASQTSSLEYKTTLHCARLDRADCRYSLLPACTEHYPDAQESGERIYSLRKISRSNIGLSRFREPSINNKR
jgi:hypothetical protein